MSARGVSERALAAALLLAAPFAAPFAAPLGAQAPDTTSWLAAAERPALPLWPAGAPGAVGDSTVDRPTITPYLPPPARATGAAAVVFAGGGYDHVAVTKEGVPAARWLVSQGIAAFVVQYRLAPRYRHPAMLQDALRAVRTVRARAAEWGVDPRRIGVVGFSAGGHMAGAAATQYDAGQAGAADPVERVGARPDFAILVYPVISMTPGLVHKGSRDRLIGARPDSAAIAARMSLETQVRKDGPPTFLLASTDDRAVPVENSLRFYEAVKAAGLPVELHVFESGRHGFGLATADPILSTWTTIATAWLGRHGMLARAESAR